MAQVMLKNKEVKSLITDFFVNGDDSPPSPPTPDTPASPAVPASPVSSPVRSPAPVPSASRAPRDAPANPVVSDSTTRPKKPRRRGRPKSAASGKSSAASGGKPGGQTGKSKGSAKTDTASKQASENGVEPQLPITAYFPVRRSGRCGMSSAEIKKARDKEMEDKIVSGCQDGLQVKEIEGKGRGVVATKAFERDDFVVEYAGDLVSITTAKQREELYERDEEVGCYMYYFCHKNKHYCIDATAESGKLGRLLNHSRKGNCYTKVVAIGDTPHLVLLAARHIDKGQELTYDYGDRSQTALQSHPWLRL